MRIERIKTKQGHPVPKQATHPKGPFPPELMQRPQVISDYVPQPDGGEEEFPLGATAQNNFKAVRWFKCKKCSEIISEQKLPSHSCEDING